MKWMIIRQEYDIGHFCEREKPWPQITVRAAALRSAKRTIGLKIGQGDLAILGRQTAQSNIF